MTAKDENNLRIFERQILRKIFGLVNIDNIWRIRNNMESDELIEGADIVRFIRARRIKWLGHIQRMDQARGELSYLAPLGSENISATYFKQCFFKGGILPPRLSQTSRLPVTRQK